MGADRARVMTTVACSVEDAFDVFTREIDRWWRRGPAYRVAGRQPGTLHLEPALGGRIWETYGADHSSVHEVGTITIWEPPAHLAFEWRSVTFVPGETTLVELWFEARGDSTVVTLEHRGWAGIRGDHPVRHGQPSGEFLRRMGMWWSEQLTSLRERVRDRDGPDA